MLKIGRERVIGPETWEWDLETGEGSMYLDFLQAGFCEFEFQVLGQL